MRQGAPSPSGGREDGPRRREALAGRTWEVRGPALRHLFEEIAPAYDRLNHWLSFGLDRRWRTWAAHTLQGTRPGPWLDLASGTGDLAVALARLENRLILRADLSSRLLRRGEAKLGRPRSASGHGGIRFPAIACEMDRLPIRDGAIAGIAQGFALRHCRDHGSFFRELFRVLAAGGGLSILDMRYPRTGGGTGFYRFYFRRLLPRLAALLGGERDAYEMMVESVRGLPSEEGLLAALSQAGFQDVQSRPGILGSVRLLTARKP